MLQVGYYVLLDALPKLGADPVELVGRTEVVTDRDTTVDLIVQTLSVVVGHHVYVVETFRTRDAFF